jgi:hypothetical protein
MQFNALELNAIALSAAAASAPRLDLYSGIHKALRAAMTDALLTLGRCDPQDDADLSATADTLRELLHFCEQHVHHEDRFMHPALHARAPGACEQAADDHHGHLEHIAMLRAELDALLACVPARRDAAALALYHRLSLFVAENFEHMLIEETRHNSALWAQYSDAELATLHNELVASIPPAEMMATLRWLVPFMAHGERCALLADMRAHAPAPAFDAALAVVQPHLSARDWGKLVQALDLPA